MIDIEKYNEGKHVETDEERAARHASIIETLAKDGNYAAFKALHAEDYRQIEELKM